MTEHEEARRDRLAELYDIEDEGRMREYALRSPESAAADLSSLLALLSKAEQTATQLKAERDDWKRRYFELADEAFEDGQAAERELEDALKAGRALEEQRNVAVREVGRLQEALTGIRGDGWLFVRTKDGRVGSMRLMRYNDDTDTPEAYIEWENQAGAGDWVEMEDQDGNWLVWPDALSADTQREP